MVEVVYADPPGWNPPGDYQLCTCEHEKILHGNGVHWQSCQVGECDCSKFVVATQSSEARAAFRREMDAGERCRACGQRAHTTEEHYRPVYGGPVCSYPDCGHEDPGLGDVLSRFFRRLVKKVRRG